MKTRHNPDRGRNGRRQSRAAAARGLDCMDHWKLQVELIRKALGLTTVEISDLEAFDK